MKTKVTALLAFGLTLLYLATLTTAASAQGRPPGIPDPDMDYSRVDWVNLGCDGKVFVCPAGDGTGISISVRDANDDPIEGAQVVPFFGGTCEGCMCDPISVFTGPDGTVTMSIYGGLNASPAPDCCAITTAMTVGGQEIPWLGTELPSDTREFISPDLNGDCVVDELDEAILNSDFGTSACRSDFDCDGLVELDDLMTYSIHFGHECESVAGVEEGDGGGPKLASLEQNSPNPFNPTTRIAFTVAEAGHVLLEIYDASGRPVRKLADAWMAPQRHEVVWDGRDEHGNEVGSAVYFYRLKIDGKLETKKMVLLK